MSKAIFFVTGLDSGGLENYLLRFLKYKHSEFSEIIVYCKGGKGGVLEEEYRRIPNVKIIKNSISIVNPLDYLKLSKWLKENKDYTICDFTGNFAGPVLWAAKIAGLKKRVVFYRSSSDRFKSSFIKNRVNKLYKQFVLKFATDILANSRYGFEFFFGKNFDDKRAKVIYNGIDAKDFEGKLNNLRNEFKIPNDAFIVGHTGRYNEAKNHTTIINVAKKITKNNKKIYFVLCGKGVSEYLNDKLTDDEKQNIRLYENRNDIPDFLNTIDLYFFPSITEGQPNALIEAMLLGVPFVASNIPPIIETVELKDYKNLYEPMDEGSFINHINDTFDTKKAKDEVLKENTKKRFNHEILFDEFYKILK